MGKLFWVGLIALTMVTQSAFADDHVFMSIGDSITSGFHGTNPGNYRDELQTQLNDAGVIYDFVGQYQLGFLDKDHQGLGGATIEYMRDNWGPVIGGYQPDFALVLAGTNNHWSPPDFASFYTLYDDLVNTILTNSPDTSIIFSTVPKFGYGGLPGLNYWSNAWVDNRNAVVFPNMNAAIYAVAANHSQVKVVDFYSAIDISTDLSADGVHPNLFGHQKLAKLFGDEVLLQINSIPEPCSGLFGLLIMIGIGMSRSCRRS